MIIELSDKKIVKGAMTVWGQLGPEVDVAMDLRALTFREGSVDTICAFHVLDALFPEEIVSTVKNWERCLKPGGRLFVVVDDYEYLARAFVGGDITVDMLNSRHNHPTQHTQGSLAGFLKDAGFLENNIVVWFESVPDLFPRTHYELVLQATKHA